MAEPLHTSASPVAGELRALLRLAGPLALAQAGNQLMSLVDVAMVGRLGPTAMGGVSIGNGLYFTVAVFGIGAVLGADAPIAQAIGAGEGLLARRLLWQALRLALLVGVPAVIVVGVASLALEAVGVSPAVAVQTRRYLLGRLPNAVPLLAFIALRGYLQAVGRTRPIVVAMVLANLTNVAGNALFVFGDATLLRLGLPAVGLPALGVTGSGLASTLSSFLSVALLAVAVRGLPLDEDPRRRRHDGALLRKILRLGSPVGLQMVAEVGVFALAGILAERFGPTAVAGHQVALTLASFSFCVALGVAAATSVRVGHHIGAGESARARRAGFLGLGAGATFMSLSALAFAIAPRLLARLLTDEAEVIAAAAPLVVIAAVFQLSDGAQAVGAGALRGAGDTRLPLWANLLGHYLVGLPVAVLLGFSFGLGAKGLWWGLSAGLTAVAIGLVLRFHRLTLRPLTRA